MAEIRTPVVLEVLQRLAAMRRVARPLTKQEARELERLWRKRDRQYEEARVADRTAEGAGEAESRG